MSMHLKVITLFGSLFLLVSIFAACGKHNENSKSFFSSINNISRYSDMSSQSSNQSVNTDNNSIYSNVSQQIETNNQKNKNMSNQINENVNNVDRKINNNTNNNGIKLTNSQMAIDYIEKTLKLNPKNTIAGSNSQYNNVDKYGKFYLIELENLQQKLNGKTGLIGYYKVYQNGKIVNMS